MMDHMLQTLHLNGYGIYVWPAYGLSLAVLALETLWNRTALLRQRRYLQTTQTHTP